MEDRIIWKTIAKTEGIVVEERKTIRSRRVRVARISYEEWLEVAQKWARIVKKVEDGEKFATRTHFGTELLNGFNNQPIMASSWLSPYSENGYAADDKYNLNIAYCGICTNCHMHYHNSMAVTCPLYHRLVNHQRVCLYMNTRAPVHFWIFMELMKEYTGPYFFRDEEYLEDIRVLALREARIIYRAILEDCPDEERAKKDNTKFIEWEDIPPLPPLLYSFRNHHFSSRYASYENILDIIRPPGGKWKYL